MIVSSEFISDLEEYTMMSTSPSRKPKKGSVIVAMLLFVVIAQYLNSSRSVKSYSGTSTFVTRWIADADLAAGLERNLESEGKKAGVEDVDVDLLDTEVPEDKEENHREPNRTHSNMVINNDVKSIPATSTFNENTNIGYRDGRQFYANRTIIWDRDFLRLALDSTPAPSINEREDWLPKLWDGKSVNISDLSGVFQDGRLVVNVISETYPLYAFWYKGQGKLCQLLRNMTLTGTSLGEENDGYSEFFLGAANSSNSIQRRRPLLNMTFNCIRMVEDRNMGLGPGNWVMALYMVRMATGLANVDFQFQCKNGQASNSFLLLPWFAGRFPPTTEWLAGRPTEQIACTDKYEKIRMDMMANHIRDDTRRMAVDILGSSIFPVPAEAAAKYQPTHPPLISNIVLDDVAIHFRCGDVLGGADRNDYVMIAFSEYTKWIDKNATKRIGILTQPFEKERNRGRDAGKTSACRQVVYLLVDYLHTHIGKDVNISIHNGRKETVPLTYARLVMANQSFTSLSTFGIFPVIGTFGQGYFQKGNRGINQFTKYLPKYPGFDNMHEMVAPKLGTGEIKKLTLNKTMEWFVTA